MHGLVLGLSRGSGWQASGYLRLFLLLPSPILQREPATRVMIIGMPGPLCFGLGPPHGLRKGDDNALGYE